MSLTLLLVLAGCGEPVSLQDEASKAAPKPKKSVEEVAAQALDPEATYSYNPAGKRDPFRSFLAEDGSSAGVGENAPPLQRWDAEKFILRGVIWNADSPRALLIDPEGTGHVVRLGTYVGRSWGKVTAITQTGVVVTEEYTTPEMEVVINPITLSLGGQAKQ